MKKLLVAAVLTIAGCGSVHPKPITIGIDEASSLGPLTSACAFKGAEARMYPQYFTPCVDLPESMLQDVQGAFESAVQENLACSGVTLKTYPNASAMTDGVDWRMKFFVQVGDDGSVSMKDSSWEIDSHVGSGSSANGAMGDPYQTSTRICAVVKGLGGKIQ